MCSMTKRIVVLTLAMLLYSGCSAQHQMSPGESVNSLGMAGRRPCVANFSIQGGYWTGYTVKSFGEYPDSAKGETFAYLISKVSSIGYLIDSSDKESVLLRASYPLTFGKGETTSLEARVTERAQSGIRMDLSFMTGRMATFSVEEVQREFCSILEGVPIKEVVKPVETTVRQASMVSEKPPVVETPIVAETLPPSAAQITPPPAPRGLVVTKRANLRAGASTKSKIIGVLKPGERLEILDQSGDWFRVKSASRLTGWIFKTLVRTVN